MNLLAKSITAVMTIFLFNGCTSYKQQLEDQNTARLTYINRALANGGAILLFPTITYHSHSAHTPDYQWKHKDGYIDEWSTWLDNKTSLDVTDITDEIDGFPAAFFSANIAPEGTNKYGDEYKRTWVIKAMRPGEYYLSFARVYFEPSEHYHPSKLTPGAKGAFALDITNSYYTTVESKQVWQDHASHKELQQTGVDEEGYPEMAWVDVVDRQAGWVNKPYIAKHESIKRDYVFDKNNSIATFNVEAGKIYIMAAEPKFHDTDIPNPAIVRGPFFDESAPCDAISLDTVDIQFKSSWDVDKFRCQINGLRYAVDENLFRFFNAIADKLQFEVKVLQDIQTVKVNYKGVKEDVVLESGVKEILYHK